MFQLQIFGIILFVQDSIFSLPFVSLLFLATRAELLVVKYRHKSRDKESPTKRKKVEHRASSNSALWCRRRRRRCCAGPIWKMDNFLTLWDIRLIFGIHTCHDNTLYSEKFFWNRMGPTSPTSLPAENLRKWITSTKIVRFGWDLVCKSVSLPYITLRNFVDVAPLICHPAWPTEKLTCRKNFKLL